MDEFRCKLVQPSVPPQRKQPPGRGIKLIQLHPLPYCRSFFAAHKPGPGLKKFQEALSIRPFLAVLLSLSLSLALLLFCHPLLPSFFFHPRRLCNLPTFFLLFSFPLFFVDSQPLLGQLFLSLSFFRILTTLARDLTDPIGQKHDESGKRLIKVRIGSINWFEIRISCLCLRLLLRDWIKMWN